MISDREIAVMKTVPLSICVSLVLAASPSLAQVTRIVDDDGQGSLASCDDLTPTFATVSAAITAAAAGDTVLVCPGTYVENINFAGKATAIRSVAGPTVTILDGNAADSVVTFASGEGPTSVLEGFTIRNGRSGFDTPGFGDGGGIRIANASPAIHGNAIVSNRACSGAGMSIRSGSVIRPRRDRRLLRPRPWLMSLSRSPGTASRRFPGVFSRFDPDKQNSPRKSA
jgi:hypothetical protein